MDVTYRLDDRITGYTDALVPKLSAVVRKTTFDIEAGAKTAVQTGAKTGRVYKRFGERKIKTRRLKSGDFAITSVSRPFTLHQASKAGEAPATDSGGLVNSIQSGFDSSLSGTVSVGAEYGAILEPDRPFLLPAAEATMPAFQAAIAAILEGR
ncbi:MAG: hypothetical protein H7Y38_16075 [Armatimonadetes bacterium]|nr:hypothetical protein [Armatimonadota bacterium]